MEIFLAWATGIALGVVCLALGWAWLGPRLPRPVRLAVLGTCAGLAVVALAVTAGLPRDYRPNDVVEYNVGQGVLFAALVVAVAGGVAALWAVGRRRTQNAGLFGTGVYLAGVGLVLYLMLNGQPTLHAPALLLVGGAVAAAAGFRLAGMPRWAARTFGPATGLIVLMVAERLRGIGSRGAGPAEASGDIQTLAAIVALLLVLGGARLLWSHGGVLARPLSLAAVALTGTAIVLVLRGPGEWAPGPAAASTTLYGLPLTLLAVAAGLAILDTPAPMGLNRGRAARSGNPRGLPMWPSWPLGVGLPVLVGVAAFWHPPPEACATVPYAESSPLSPDGAAWAVSPGPAAPRGAPDVTAFNQLCAHRTPGVSQVVYVYVPTCKWAQVDSNYPLVQATGTLDQIDLSNGDSPWLHTTHDLQLDVDLDPESDWVGMEGAPSGSLLHVEVEAGSFPVAYRPAPGDRVTVAGRWVFDCGHDPKTEIHPAAVVAGEHDEWRADMAGGPRRARVLRVWMNSASGIVPVHLAPFDMRAGFPSPPEGRAATPVVQVVAGAPDAVRWTIEGGSGGEPQAAVHIVPPDPNGSAYFELLLGYEEVAPAPEPPISYTITLDSIVVRDDLREQARNTTGVPIGPFFPQLGFPGTGNWIMQAVIGHTWVSLLDNAPVESGQTYSLADVPPVSVLAPGDERLRLSITGYAENDPSEGVKLASGSVTGPAMLTWDAGRLADLCCDKAQTFLPAHGAWELSYRVTKSGP